MPQFLPPQDKIISALTEYLNVRNKTKKNISPHAHPSTIISQEGICSGLSKLWAFTQRQQERKINNQSIDNDLYDFDKLNTLINDIVTWKNNGAKASEIEWNKNDTTHLIKSQDLELLISSVNLMQKPSKSFISQYKF